MANIIYNPDRDITDSFLKKVNLWIDATGEVLVVIRYLCGAGSKDYSLINTHEEFKLLVDVCPEGADIIVFKEKQLPVRGIIDEDFIKMAIKHVNENEFMFLVTKPEKENDPRCFGTFDFASHLEEELRDSFGEVAAVGICPEFMVEDHEGMISASKGGLDGPR